MSSNTSAYSGSRSYKSTATSRSARSDHTRQHAEHSRRDPAPSKQDGERSKRDTEHYLQYYQSSVADGQPDESDQESSWIPQLRRQTSGGSTSPSDYSDSQSTDFSTNAASTVTSKATRRSKAPSDGGSDRRRLAIVEMDSLDDSPPSRSKDGHSQGGSIRSRRGLPSSLAGLALVAPPDAAPTTYSHLTPPTTAPATGDISRAATSRDAQTVPRVLVESDKLNPPGDQRSRHSRSPSPSAISDASDQTHGLLSPVQHARPGMTRGGTQKSLILTPEIGEEKDISTRVAAPVVINLESARPFRRRETPGGNDGSQVAVQPFSATPFATQEASGYLHYQPGVHATAGPLPPPPRAMFNIDTNSPAPPRPPRLHSPFSTRGRGDIEAVKQALQLPPSVTAALASRTPRSNPNKYTESPETKIVPLEESATETGSTISTSTSELRHSRSVHRREGAFSPSASTSTATTSDMETPAPQKAPQVDTTLSDHPRANAKIDDDTKSTNNQAVNDDEVPPITVIHSMQPIEEQQERRDDDDMADMISSLSARRRASDELSAGSGSRSRSPPYIGHSGETPSPPPKSFRNSLTTNLKRLSSTLPRTPSLSSKSRRSSGGTFYSSRTPSPSMHVVSPPPVRQKIKSAYPPAMFYAEITTRKTSLERCSLYAQKINELYMYDSGLADWTIETKLRANNNRPTVAFSSHTFTPQPRHTSRASMISEATFPRRPDASTATDLSIKTQDLVPATPPALPYPSLANQRMYPARSSSIASGTPPSSLRSLAPPTPTSKSAGGFFASLGRKASMSSARKDKPAPLTPSSTTSSARLLTKNPPATAVPRVVNVSNTPSVPGGPRAAPHHRVARSQTIMTTTNPFTSTTPPADRSETLGRRPSQYDIKAEAVFEISATPEFTRQVDKLVHLLPDADRAVLAGYLRRAGQDILAIGQYLEDEKNGTIKAP
ncbi:hypothetical protein FPV67DRAFT_1470357 [Lyophyllum atratum]|nr:hypothetical protein FPV67DRAFT_1470357 [Lyophyllum atratum]